MPVGPIHATVQKEAVQSMCHRRGKPSRAPAYLKFFDEFPCSLYTENAVPNKIPVSQYKILLPRQKAHVSTLLPSTQPSFVPDDDDAILDTHGTRRRARSQRARGGVELRQPKRDSVINEDRHKFIHDGKEYSRAPNLFDVGGELKLLPEVFSDLNFEAREFVDDGTTEEQRELRDSRPWGRLYVNGWPVPIQYMRSHFGGPAAEGMQSMVLADPLDACEPLRNEGSSIGER